MSKRKTTGLPKKRKAQESVNQDANTENEGGVLSNVLGQQYENRQEREAHMQRLVLFGIGGLVGLLIILILAAVLWETLLVPRQTVAVVDGESISITEFQERVRLERLIGNQRFYNDIPFLINLGLINDPNQILQQEPYGTLWGEITGQPELLGSRVLDDMINEEIIRQEAEERGVTIDQSVVDEQVEEFFNLIIITEEPSVTEEATEETDPTATPTPFVSPTPSRTPTTTPTATLVVTEEAAATEEANATEEVSDVEPTLTPRPTDPPTATPSNEERQAEFENDLTTFFSDGRSANLDEATVREYFEYQALLSALRDDVTADIGETAPWVNTRHILVETEEEAQNVLTALEEGESFADLARAVSTDTGSGSRGGELGWALASGFVPPFRDATIEAEIGEIVGPVESEFGFHIIQVRAREDRELSENELERAKDTAFNEWLEEVTNEENHDITRNDNWPAHVPSNPVIDINRLLDTTPTGPNADT